MAKVAKKYGGDYGTTCSKVDAWGYNKPLWIILEEGETAPDYISIGKEENRYTLAGEPVTVYGHGETAREAWEDASLCRKDIDLADFEVQSGYGAPSLRSLATQYKWEGAKTRSDQELIGLALEKGFIGDVWDYHGPALCSACGTLWEAANPAQQCPRCGTV